MLEELIGVDDVELGTGEVEMVDVAGDETDVVDRFLRRVRTRMFEYSGRDVESDYLAGRDGSGQTCCHGAGTAAGVEQAHSGLEAGQEEPGFYLGAAARM